MHRTQCAASSTQGRWLAVASGHHDGTSPRTTAMTPLSLSILVHMQLLHLLLLLLLLRVLLLSLIMR
jgi:hypothetical protein